VEGPIRIRELGNMAPEIHAVHSVRNQNRLSSKTNLEILSSFPRKEMNTKVEDNFVAHNLDTEFALFGVQTWEIWRRQGRAANQKNMDETDFMETKFASLRGGFRARQGGARPKTPQGHKYNPLGVPRWLPIDIHSSESRHKMRDEIR
jgi:hypothetical protein